MFEERAKITDWAKVEIHNMTPEEIEYANSPEGQERQRRIKETPLTWYCIAANKDEFYQAFWIDYLSKGDWIKFVEDDGTVITGKILSVECATVTLEPDTILCNQKLYNQNDIHLLLLRGIQVFIDNKDSADEVKQIRKKINGNG